MGGKRRRALRGDKGGKHLEKEHNHKHQLVLVPKLSGEIFEQCSQPKCGLRRRKA